MDISPKFHAQLLDLWKGLPNTDGVRGPHWKDHGDRLVVALREAVALVGGYGIRVQAVEGTNCVWMLHHPALPDGRGLRVQLTAGHPEAFYGHNHMYRTPVDGFIAADTLTYDPGQRVLLGRRYEVEGEPRHESAVETIAKAIVDAFAKHPGR